MSYMLQIHKKTFFFFENSYFSIKLYFLLFKRRVCGRCPGANNIRGNAATQITLTNTDFTVNENYEYFIRNDFAVVRLPEAVTLNDKIRKGKKVL